MMTPQIYADLKRYNYDLWRFRIPLNPARDLERDGWDGQDSGEEDGGEDGLFDFPCRIYAPAGR